MTVVSTTHPAHQIVPRATFSVVCHACGFGHDSDAATGDEAIKAIAQTHQCEGSTFVATEIIPPTPIATLENRVTGLEALIAAMDKTNNELRAENDKLRAEMYDLRQRVNVVSEPPRG